jgi:hypothetical protein
MSSLVWLPPLVLLSDCGDWDTFINVLYMYFKKDFIDSIPAYCGRKLGLKRHPLVDGREATFWHLITEGSEEASRQPDEARCERIRWPRPMIERIPCVELHCWENSRQREKRILIALPDYSYVVVLAERAGYLLPWTAYPVERQHRRTKLRNECEQYQRSTKS